MRQRANRFGVFGALLRNLLPPWGLCAGAAFVEHPSAILLLLFANTLLMTGLGQVSASGVGGDVGAAGRSAHRGFVHFLLLAGYTALVALVLAGPAWWLRHDGAMPAALLLSAASLVAWFVAWRTWPVFALPFLEDGSCPANGGEPGLLASLRRSLGHARRLTAVDEHFAACALPGSIALLILSSSALVLAVPGLLPAGSARAAGIATYAFLLPVFGTLLLNRCLRLLSDEGGGTVQVDSVVASPVSGESLPQLPEGLGFAELNATLQGALQSGQVDLALAALDRGADPNAVPVADLRDQRSPLVIAATLPDLRALRALIAKGADVNRAHGGITPLLAATRDSYRGRPDVVTTLLANGADARFADGAGNTPLHHAARCIEPIVAALLVDAGADLDAVNDEGMTALGIASATANWSTVSYLLDRGARPDVDAAQPALMLAAAIDTDDPTGVSRLLKSRASVGAVDASMRTPLMVAAANGHRRIAEALLASGAPVDAADAGGMTALMEAARAGTVAVIHALGKRKATLDARDSLGRTALVIACQSRDATEETVRALLALGADREQPDNDGKRALDHAVAAGRWHIVALLDPARPLPSSLAGSPELATPASTDHLLDALRFGHWNICDEIGAAVADWPPSALADVYRALGEPDQEAARTWLLNHGLARDVRLSDGRPLLDSLVEALPDSVAALAQ